MVVQDQAAEQREHVDVICKLARKSRARPHLVTVGKSFSGKTRFTIHTSNAVSDRKARKQLLNDMRASCIDVGFRIRCHSARKISRATSLEALDLVFGGDRIAFDPLGAFSRSRAMVNFAARIREELGDCVSGIYWSTAWQTLYVVLDHRRYLEENKFQRIDLVTAEKAVVENIMTSCGDEVSNYVRAVRLRFQVPSIALVPVDKASYWNRSGIFNRLGKRLNAPAFATVLGLAGASVGTTAIAADANLEPTEVSEPAVSGPNAKIAISGGFLNLGEGNIDDDNGFGAISGSLSVPLSERMGLQIDGAAGTLDDGNFHGIGGHLFLRDPNVGLLGIVGAFVDIDRDAPFLDQDIGYVAAETEIYLDDFTFSAVAGGSFGDNLDDGFIGSVDFGWYATDDFYWTVGAATSGETSIVGTASFEWQPAVDGLSGMSFFAEGAVGSDDYASVNAGIRFYFGDGPSLKDRHRRDDPPPNSVMAPLTEGAVRTKAEESSSSSYPYPTPT
ncbi:MAG: hypothetical protein AAGA76_02710 [Pseudomonadota bacterium]